MSQSFTNQNFDTSVGFKTCNNILDKWGCSISQKANILGIDQENFVSNNAGKTVYTSEQLQRLSYVLNIHASLSTMFSNPDNIYNFMSMNNENAYYSGRSPLSLIEDGSLTALSDIYIRLESKFS